MRITGSVEIAAPPERVFAVLADPARMPEWQSDLVSMEPLDGPGMAAGSKLRQVRRAGPRKITSTAEVMRYEPGSALAVASEDAAVKARGTWTLTPTGGGTRLDLDFTIEAGGFQGLMLRVFSGVAQKQAAKDLQAFKALAEAQH